MTGRVKKLFGLLLCMVLLVCLMPVSAYAEAPTVAVLPVAAAGLTYDGEEHELVTAGAASQGEMQYRLDNSTWSASIPKATDAGDYTVYYKAVLDSEQSSEGSVTVTIACKNVGYEIGVPNGLEGTYGQSLSDVTLPVYDSGDLAGTWSWANPDQKLDSVNANGKAYSAIYTPYNTNLFVPTTHDVLVVVNPAILEATGTGIAKGVYGDKLSELTIEGLTVTSGGSAVAGTWAFADTVDGDAIPAVGDTNTYDVVFTPDDSNYGTKTAEVTLSISPKKVTVTGLKAIDRVYDGTTDVELDITGAKLVGVLDGDVVTLTGSSASVENANAEENKPVINYGLSLTGAHAGNYTLGSVPALTVNISKYVVTCTGITVEDKVYDGTTAHTYTGTLSVGELPQNLNCAISDPATATVSFEDPNVGEDKALIISGITVRDGNSVDITDNFEFIASVTASITPAKVTVTPHSNQSKTYGDADPESFGFTAEGLVAPDTLSGKLGRQSGQNAGVYRFTIGSLENPNYEIILKDAYFTINRLQLTGATVAVKDFEYDGASHKGLVSVKLGGKELVEGTDFTVEGAEASTVGSHLVTVKGMGNYSGQVTDTWVIDLPAIAKDVSNGTITKDNVLTDLTADKIDALVELDAALNSIVNNPDATAEEKQDVQAVANKLIPIMDVLNEEAKDIVGQIEKWLNEKLPKADADELEMREEYEKLQTWLKGEGKTWAKVVEGNLGKELEKMKEKLYTYVIIVGNGSHWLTTSDDDLGFRANGHLSLFTYVKVDGKVPERDSYTLYHGSTIVMLHNDYLKTLDKGWHEIQFVYSDGVSNVGKFQVTDRWVEVATGDESDMGLWLGFMLMAGLGMAVCVPRLVRRKNEN